MKTSNIIFLSFLIFLFGGITLLYVGSKYHDGDNDEANFVKQEKALPPFSVIVVETWTRVNLMSGKENKIIQSRSKNNVSKFAPFVVRNDTLFISSAKQVLKENTHYIDAEVFCVNIKSIVAKGKSYVDMTKFQMDTLNISMNKSKFYCRNFEKIALAEFCLVVVLISQSRSAAPLARYGT